MTGLHIYVALSLCWKFLSYNGINGLFILAYFYLLLPLIYSGLATLISRSGESAFLQSVNARHDKISTKRRSPLRTGSNFGGGIPRTFGSPSFKRPSI